MPEKKHPLRNILLLFCLGTGLGLVFVIQGFISSFSGNRPYEWRNVVYELTYWYSFVAFIPAMIWAARKHRLGRPNKTINLIRHFIWDFVISIVQTILSASLLLYIVLAFNLSNTTDVSGILTRSLPGIALSGFATFWKYWVVIGTYYAFDYHRKYQEREARSAQLEKSLALSNLQNLKMQLHPHFLFNALHAIGVLMFEDVTVANGMLVKLSDLLRATLNSAGENAGGGGQEISLREELDFINRYLEIEKIRFHDRLVVEMDIGPETLDAKVPSLILQPLIENSIRHGISSKAGQGIINIAAKRTGDRLQLTVRDNGIGIKTSKENLFNKGIGLTNTKSRLDYLYGDDYRFEFMNGEPGGLIAEITIPFKESSGNRSDDQNPVEANDESSDSRR